MDSKLGKQAQRADVKTQILSDAVAEIASIEAVSSIVEEVLECGFVQVQACAGSRAQLKADLVQRSLLRLRRRGQSQPALPARSLSTVDFGTVHSALTAAGRIAARDAADKGLTPAGRT